MKPKDRRGISTSNAYIYSKATNPRDKTTMGTLDSHLINFATAREAVATRKNNDKAEDKTHKKQSRVALHQKRFRYLIKILIHSWF